MAKYKAVWSILISIVGISSCNKEDLSEELFFVGDSNIEFWDVQYDFPEFITHNLGKAGSGIDYIKQKKLHLQGKTVIVITGTNDISHGITKNVDDYAEMYANVLSELDASRVLLISILPQGNIASSEVNEHISHLNNRINSLINDKRIEYLDVFESFLLDDAFNPALSYDGIHLNRRGYECLTSKIRKKI